MLWYLAHIKASFLRLLFEEMATGCLAKVDERPAARLRSSARAAGTGPDVSGRADDDAKNENRVEEGGVGEGTAQARDASK